MGPKQGLDWLAAKWRSCMHMLGPHRVGRNKVDLVGYWGRTVAHGADLLNPASGAR